MELMDLLVKNGFFGNHHESEQLVDVFGKNPKLLQEMAAVFESNEHLYPMVEEIRMLCIRIVAQSLDMGNEELTGKLTETINAYKDHPELLGDELTGIVQEYLHDQGLSATVGDDVIQEIADVINQEFAGQDYVTEQEVIDFVLTYAQGNLTDEEIGNVVPGYGDDWTNGN
jgi:hypothetical protein